MDSEPLLGQALGARRTLIRRVLFVLVLVVLFITFIISIVALNDVNKLPAGNYINNNYNSYASSDAHTSITLPFRVRSGAAVLAGRVASLSPETDEVAQGLGPLWAKSLHLNHSGEDIVASAISSFNADVSVYAYVSGPPIQNPILHLQLIHYPPSNISLGATYDIVFSPITSAQAQGSPVIEVVHIVAMNNYIWATMGSTEDIIYYSTLKVAPDFSSFVPPETSMAMSVSPMPTYQDLVLITDASNPANNNALSLFSLWTDPSNISTVLCDALSYYVGPDGNMHGWASIENINHLRFELVGDCYTSPPHLLYVAQGLLLIAKNDGVKLYDVDLTNRQFNKLFETTYGVLYEDLVLSLAAPSSDPSAHLAILLGSRVSDGQAMVQVIQCSRQAPYIQIFPPSILFPDPSMAASCPTASISAALLPADAAHPNGTFIVTCINPQTGTTIIMRGLIIIAQDYTPYLVLSPPLLMHTSFKPRVPADLSPLVLALGDGRGVAVHRTSTTSIFSTFTWAGGLAYVGVAEADSSQKQLTVNITRAGLVSIGSSGVPPLIPGQSYYARNDGLLLPQIDDSDAFSMFGARRAVGMALNATTILLSVMPL